MHRNVILSDLMGVYVDGSFNEVNDSAIVRPSGNGLTRIRLRLKLKTNGDAVANYLSLLSGKAAIATNALQLIVRYCRP